MRYSNQKVAVLGAGLSGAAAAILLKAEGADVTVLDSADENKLLKSTIDNLRAQNIRVICGQAADQDSGKYDFVVASPGIDPASALAQNFSSRKIDIIGELELGWRSCETRVIAITGTNGKTTTTELIAQMMNASGQRTIACGNIGKPLTQTVRDQSKFDLLTVEVSSFQLETIKSFRPTIAVWLNFAPDHLDRYSSVSEYRAAKLSWRLSLSGNPPLWSFHCQLDRSLGSFDPPPVKMLAFCAPSFVNTIRRAEDCPPYQVGGERSLGRYTHNQSSARWHNPLRTGFIRM